MKKLVDTSAPLNCEATFTVEFEGNPVPEVKWFRNGLELSSSGRYRISTKPNEFKSTLIFNEAWDTDNNSKISCEIVNPLGRETCEATFTVKSKKFRLLMNSLNQLTFFRYCLAPPRLTREPDDQRVPLGETLKVKIPISGKGPFNFKVKRNDQLLDNSDRVRIQEYDDYIVVTIPGVYFLFQSIDRLLRHLLICS